MNNIVTIYKDHEIVEVKDANKVENLSRIESKKWIIAFAVVVTVITIIPIIPIAIAFVVGALFNHKKRSHNG